MEDSDSLDAENSFIESVETAPDFQDADEPEVLPPPDPARGSVSGRWLCR